MNELYTSKIDSCFDNIKGEYELSKNKKWHYFSKESLLNNAGYKLHVSCSVDILSRNIDKYIQFLLSIGVNFKIPRNLDIARKITNGDFGLSQVGKTITIYLDDHFESVNKIAVFFSETNGPLIPFEIPINEKKTVFIRFGAYRLQCEYDIFGRPVPVYYLGNDKIHDNRESKLQTTKLPKEIQSFDKPFDLNNELENKFLCTKRTPRSSSRRATRHLREK